MAGIVQFKQLLQTGFSPMMLIPFAMFVFGCLMVNVGFKKESRISKTFLAELLEQVDATPNNNT